jgi:NDP-sugar pyrophosphorylase family protein
MTIPVIVIAGGLGTRIATLARNRPKSLIEIRGKPFLEWQLEMLSKNGIKDVVLCLSYQSEQIIEYLTDQKNLEMNIQYSLDGEIQLGTGGAVKKALPLVSGPFFVLYGDSYLLTRFKKVQEFYFGQGRQALMTVIHRSKTYEKPNVELSQETILNYSKVSTRKEMDFIDYGLTILNEHCFEFFKSKNSFDLTEVFTNLLSRDELVGYEVQDGYFEVGSLHGYSAFEMYLDGGKR